MGIKWWLQIGSNETARMTSFAPATDQVDAPQERFSRPCQEVAALRPLLLRAIGGPFARS
jgi:hypothetical protein